MGIKRFSSSEQEQIKLAIEKAEFMTSGEIRVFVEATCPIESVLDRAAFQFNKLKMHKTEQRNGVLIYLAVDDRRIAIIGDSGIHSKLNTTFWDDTKDAMIEQFKQGKMTEGLCIGIALVGEQLKNLFPYQKNDQNELPNEIAHE
jgi:uncharacterized membrane protein